MSSHGLREDTSIASGLTERSENQFGRPSPTTTQDAETQTSELDSLSRPTPTGITSENGKSSTTTQRNNPTRRIQFGQFAEQLRQEQYFNDKKKLLQKRKRILQKTITLSARLHRVSSWVGDGLVEISEQADAAGFVRLHQHMQNLIDLSHSQWDRELHALDPLGIHNSQNTQTAGSTDVLSKLSSSAQANLFELLTSLRSNPRFLVERFKALAAPQIVSLWSAPRFHRQQFVESQYGSLASIRGRTSYQRSQSYSKQLEDYASSFERSNPLAFLMYNIYGTDQASIDTENQLRLSTWSTVCAELMLAPGPAFYALILNLLNCFASLYEWRAKDSVEMFLMDILQRGAFLLDQPSNSSGRHYSRHDQLKTPQAQEFFDTAVRELFLILYDCGGGFPTGALQLASAVLHKLPLQQQKDFRGIFFSQWFLDNFLQPRINYPEHEDMLLKFHISTGARQKILRQLWLTIRERVHDVYSTQPTMPVDDALRINVEKLVGLMESADVTDPYAKTNGPSLDNKDYNEASIAVSVPELVQVLEALSPQALSGSRPNDHYFFERSSVYGHYLQASNRFDNLRSELLTLLEPGSSTIDVHPCQEAWLQIDVDSLGKPTFPYPQTEISANSENDDLDIAQQAALRLLKDRMRDSKTSTGMSYRNDFWKSTSLNMLFQNMEISTYSRIDPIAHSYWVNAIEFLHDKYPASTMYPRSKMQEDDSAVLMNLYMISQTAQAKCRESCSQLEVQMSILEDTCLRIRSAINKSMDQIESLRLKVWYSVDVVPSKHYEDAKNIARALTNMALTSVQDVQTGDNSFYSTSRPASASSSMFEQPYKETINLMKASTEHGGPKKLADQQVELTNNWLLQNRVENFCKGEERIHRFCMEVHTVARHLIGETLSESPVLWASELFARERSLFDVRPFGITSAPASTRPASVVSDTMSTSYRSSRPILHSADSLRMALFEDRRVKGSNRISRECLPPELASSIGGSLSRAHSATTAESVSSIFSPYPTNSRSLTTASIYSRSASLYNDPSLSRFTDTSRAKAKFLAKVHQVLICLLLSDLGCPVWGSGSETDAMLDKSHNMELVEKRLQQRIVAESLTNDVPRRQAQPTSIETRQRSHSFSEEPSTRRVSLLVDNQDDPDDLNQHTDELEEGHLTDLHRLLWKLGQEVDPVEKLAVAEEFYQVSLSTFGARSLIRGPGVDDRSQNHSSVRRGSLDDQTSQVKHSQPNDTKSIQSPQSKSAGLSTVHEIIQHLKSDLTRLQPKTLFRDLQYISAFVPMNFADSARGKALMQLGLAALAYKDEVCRSMVDLADQTLSENSRSTPQALSMLAVTELWMFAAREGNAVAQRELALLYLSRPELLPVMSLPLSIPSQTFHSDMLWHERNSLNPNKQALCLALHWMQQASANGDKVAKLKLQERNERYSIQ